MSLSLERGITGVATLWADPCWQSAANIQPDPKAAVSGHPLAPEDRRPNTCDETASAEMEAPNLVENGALPAGIREASGLVEGPEARESEGPDELAPPLRGTYPKGARRSR